MLDSDSVTRDVVFMLAPEELHNDILALFTQMENTPAQSALHSLLWLREALTKRMLRKEDFMTGLMTGVAIARASRTELFQTLVKEHKKQDELAKGANVRSFMAAKTKAKT